MCWVDYRWRLYGTYAWGGDLHGKKPAVFRAVVPKLSWVEEVIAGVEKDNQVCFQSYHGKPPRAGGAMSDN